MKKFFIIFLSSLCCIFCLSACKSEKIVLNYLAEEGGGVFGELSQTLEAGGDCTQVYAIAEAGYRFVGWDDGVKSAQRLDINVTENKTITAKFENVLVQFYSEGNKVREYALNDFVAADTSRVVGYSSFKVFDGWEFSGSYSGYNSYFSGEPLDVIKTYFAKQSDINDITLRAVYIESSEGDVPANSKTIAHGLGGFDGNDYANSKEAFEASYKKGFRFFEADLSLTSDDKIVVYHWLNKSVTYDEFMGTATDTYTPLGLEDFLNLVYTYKDVKIDLDVLSAYYAHYDNIDNNFEIFFKEFDKTLKSVDPTGSLYERLILELLPNNRTDMYNISKKYCSFGEYLYAEYFDSTSPITDENIETVAKWCKDNGVSYLSIGVIKEEWVEILHSYDIYVMVFTYNDYIQMYNYFDMGVDCIFTDFAFI